MLRIRQPSSNVCDTCWLFQHAVKLSHDASDLETKVVEQATHMQRANDMKREYKNDCMLALEGMVVVLSIDYAQNLTLPNAPEIPSKFYFLSLYNVYCFGVVDEGHDHHYHYLYGEDIAGKGSNDVISLLQKYITENVLSTTRSLVVYADNCGGQNKNNLMIFYLLWLVDSGRFDDVKLKFQVKGHTRNSCDRGFGCFKNAYVHNKLYYCERYCRSY